MPIPLVRLDPPPEGARPPVTSPRQTGAVSRFLRSATLLFSSYMDDYVPPPEEAWEQASVVLTASIVQRYPRFLTSQMLSVLVVIGGIFQNFLLIVAGLFGVFSSSILKGCKRAPIGAIWMVFISVANALTP